MRWVLLLTAAERAERLVLVRLYRRSMSTGCRVSGCGHWVRVCSACWMCCVLVCSGVLGDSCQEELDPIHAASTPSTFRRPYINLRRAKDSFTTDQNILLAFLLHRLLSHASVLLGSRSGRAIIQRHLLEHMYRLIRSTPSPSPGITPWAPVWHQIAILNRRGYHISLRSV